MTDFEKLKEFYKGKRVLVTGHTGFKGSYLTVLLSLLGAEVYGYALAAPSEPSLFEILYGRGSSQESRKNLCVRGVNKAGTGIRESQIGDIRDYDKLQSYVNRIKPDVIIHMAAQPIVRTSYRIPRETFETNVMGTVNLLEALRQYAGKRPAGAQPVSFLNVTTDKVYKNEERRDYAYREDDKLDGFDPYSNSKSCSELATHSYAQAFFQGPEVEISTARAGNVIGGGDFAEDRIIPDCIRAMLAGKRVGVRNPYSTRPFQHVLEPLMVYLTIAMQQARDPKLAGNYNVGPDLEDCLETGQLTDLFAKYADGFTWENQAQENAPHEANFLRLDNKKIKDTFGWKPRWHIDDAVKASVDWAKAYRESEEAANRELLRQIESYGNRG